jgi:hypothetical protein
MLYLLCCAVSVLPSCVAVVGLVVWLHLRGAVEVLHAVDSATRPTSIKP